MSATTPSDAPSDTPVGPFDATWLEVGGRVPPGALDPTVTMRRLHAARVDASAETIAPRAPGSISACDPGALPLLDAAELETTGSLGEGGMGKVELAVQRSLGREVAVKSVSAAATPGKVQALLQEARFTGSLEHPNIVPVHQLGRDPAGLPLLVMKRVEGVSWRELIEEPDHPHWQVLGAGDPLRRHVEILISVCNALEFAHARGVLHRDIKPENVMVGAFGEVYLLDWGLAAHLERLGETTAIVGTPAYMAPEMLYGEARLTTRTDVYLLGATLHHALAGQVRHPGRSATTVLQAALRSAPVDYPPDVPAELAELCNRATAADPARRPGSVAELRRALERFLEHRGSAQLAAQAAERLVELRALLAAPAPEAERVASAFAECRFGFQQALRAWPGNEPAAAGLQACLRLMVERELERKNHGAAETLLAELPRPDPALADRVAALRDELASEAAPRERLRALRREHDIGIGGEQRVGWGLAVGLAAFLTLGGLGLLERQGAFTARHEHLLVWFLSYLVVMPVATWPWRHLAWGTTANRRLAACSYGGALCGAFNHVLCMILGIDVETAIAFDGLMMTTASVVMGLAIDPRILWATPIVVAMTVGIALAPGALYFIAAVGHAAMIALVPWVLRRGSAFDGPEQAA